VRQNIGLKNSLFLTEELIRVRVHGSGGGTDGNTEVVEICAGKLQRVSIEKEIAFDNLRASLESRITSWMELPSGIWTVAAAFVLGVRSLRMVRFFSCVRWPDEILMFVQSLLKANCAGMPSVCSKNTVRTLSESSVVKGCAVAQAN
jgi:hypothetical protein